MLVICALHESYIVVYMVLSSIGDRITWSYWRSGQSSDNHPGFLFPKGVLEDCAQIRADDFYKWHDYPCGGGIDYHYSSICEHSKCVEYLRFLNKNYVRYFFTSSRL